MTTKKSRKKIYTRSAWSGKAYETPPTVGEIMLESLEVLRRNPAVNRATSPEAMTAFIERYKTQNGLNAEGASS